MQLTGKQEERLAQLREKLAKITREIGEIGFVIQGSVVERWKTCGKPGCHCQGDPAQRHGPYYQWSWKRGGKTYSVSLTKEQATLCAQWIRNNRKLDKKIRHLRRLSLQAARLYKIDEK